MVGGALSPFFINRNNTLRYKLTIEYDGTNLLGWQRQLDGPSVQQYLEEVLEILNNGQHHEIPSAGRTDAGVHALAQIAMIELDRDMELFKIREAFNAQLRQKNAPVSVRNVEVAAPDFHPRFSALGRGYIYRILNHRAPSVLRENRVWWVPVPLDIEKMRQAAKYLLGNHDFTSFRAAACQAKSPVKTLDRLDIESIDDEIIFTVEARSFLHHQVRNMVGTLKLVGDGHLQPEDMLRILEAKDRTQAGPTAPACGLYLNKVWY